MTKYVPTDKSRIEVTALKSCGITNDLIAQYLGISHDTLERHYRHELSTAQIKANTEMAMTLYKKGLNGDVTAMIFWLKTRAKWRTEDAKILDSNEDIKKEIIALREKLDAENKKDY